MGDDDSTQLTQGVVDPRRMGHNNSGLSETDVADIICILHPSTPAAFQVVATTAALRPRNVLQQNAYTASDLALSPRLPEEQETFILDGDAPNHPLDLALRFSALPINPALGFVFGRSERDCDIILAHDTHKRISNLHFSLYVNDSGVLMLQDMSTNGTMVDSVLLKGRTPEGLQQTRMLGPGSMIEILSTAPSEVLKFIVRIPSREGYADEYQRRFKEYRRQTRAHLLQRRPGPAIQEALPPHKARTHSIKAPLLHNQYGMHWGGGDKYNVVGMIGKGAFATVYQLATKKDGYLYAAKELEKRKFMKNGVLDRKVSNEMDIMKSVSHPNIISFIDYHDQNNHLYIIMEFVGCGDLAQFVTNHGPLPEQLGKVMASQVLDALHYLHSNRITHRDIKPDNILIADMSPDNFTIKLTDFGLSKVVPDNETFLKTFCGTLLYCAPEVFPFYEKRKTPGSSRPRRKYVYSQSVDIWSFGAVLWYTLSNEPPFEGVADPTGKGMYEKITSTPLNSTALLKRGVSQDAVALLVGMLNTDPAVRPTPAECLNHIWFADLHLPDVTTGASQYDLLAIEEEEELDTTHADVASLSLGDKDEGSDFDEASIHSGSMNFFDPRQSKRLKSSVYAYREPADAIDSSPEVFQTIPVIYQPNGRTNPPPATAPAKLFGEVSESYLATLTKPRDEVIARPDTAQPHTAQPHTAQRHLHADEGYITQNGPASRPEAQASPSLLGAESLLRDVHMGDSRGDSASPPAEPSTPENVNGGKPAQKSSQGQEDITPKPLQKPFDRHLRIPVKASFYYDPNDPTTHNDEYASRVSGHDFKANPSMLIPREAISLPATNGSTTDDENRDDTDVEHESAKTPAPEASFVKPPPRMGRLVSTEDSFAAITIQLNQKRTSWGRATGNTYVYPNPHDTRIPKDGIIIEFHARGGSRDEEDVDLTKLPHLHAWLATLSTRGLKVNGTQLDPGPSGHPKFGKLYTGDLITVQAPHKNQRGLTFRCEFFHGESKNARPKNKRFEIESMKASSPPAGEERAGKGKA